MALYQALEFSGSAAACQVSVPLESSCGRSPLFSAVDASAAEPKSLIRRIDSTLLALVLNDSIAGTAMAASTKMMAMTTRTSIKVKPRRRGMGEYFVVIVVRRMGDGRLGFAPDYLLVGGKLAGRAGRGQQHAVIAVELLEGRDKFARFGRILQVNKITQFGHHAGLNRFDRDEVMVNKIARETLFESDIVIDLVGDADPQAV